MASRAISRWKIPYLSAIFVRNATRTPLKESKFLSGLVIPGMECIPDKTMWILKKYYHDGRPRGPLWRGKKLIGKEALFVILGLKRFKDDEEKLQKFIKSHVLRLLKMDMIAVLTELERQEQVSLAVMVCFHYVASP